MNYTENKAKEWLSDKFGQDIPPMEQKKMVQFIKEIIRDTRHKCAENIFKAGDTICQANAHNIVMNTNLDI